MDHTEIKYHPLHDHFVQCCFKGCLFGRSKTIIKDARKRTLIIKNSPLLQRTVSDQELQQISMSVLTIISTMVKA